MATFNEKRSSSFGKYVAEQDVLMPNLLQSLHFLDRTSPFLLEKSNLKFLVFRVFLTRKEDLVATFSEMRAPTSR